MHMKYIYMYMHFTCMSVLSACGLCITCVSGAYGSQKKVRIPGIQMVVSHQLDAGNLAQAVCQSNKCFYYCIISQAPILSNIL